MIQLWFWVNEQRHASFEIRCERQPPPMRQEPDGLITLLPDYEAYIEPGLEFLYSRGGGSIVIFGPEYVDGTFG